ncbi:MAG: alpha/beta hydrolase [Acinetobacter sp.]|nr:alpha/beta hydrolase [Acinetobacter sp.]MDN5490371.1 alpha/beta hydrolase [Acinetobacter sp.]MDN5625786.1 alpha/beta hydrolase [Acinetobacter sp.]
MTSLTLSFNDVNFSPVEQNGQIWLTATELAKALGYAKSDAVTQVYERNQDEFNSSMTTTLNLSINDSVETLNLSVSKKSKNLTKTIRIFSLRGCHLIAMFSKTDIAKQFRKWVLDILDKEVGNPIAKTHKEEREPLTSAVNLLVAKTKHLNYSDAYKLVHQRFNVKHIDEIPYDEIPVAVEYVHYLIALYSQTEKQGSLFDKDDYELIRQMTEAILAQNGAMDNVWKALELVAPNDFIYFHQYIMESNVLARKVSIGFDFKTKCGTPLVDQYCRTINFSTGARMGVNPKWFNAPA